MRTTVGQYSRQELFCLWTKVQKLFSPTWGVIVDQLLFRFSICGSVPEIFAIKVESCQKSRKFLDVFLPSQILGGKPSKNCTMFITPGSRHVVWIKICDDIPISCELIDVCTLNFENLYSPTLVDRSKRKTKLEWFNCLLQLQ